MSWTALPSGCSSAFTPISMGPTVAVWQAAITEAEASNPSPPTIQRFSVVKSTVLLHSQISESSINRAKNIPIKWPVPAAL